MNLWALDDFLVSKLEAVMARSVISPYAIARFCLTGSVLSSLAVGGLEVTGTDVIGASIWLIQAVLTAAGFASILVGERDNNCGYLNRFKIKYHFTRTVTFVATVLIISRGFYSHSLADVFALIYFPTLLSALYLMSINWIQPKRKESKLLTWMKFKHA